MIEKALQEKLTDYGEQIEESRERRGELEDEQAKILRKRFEEVTPLMRFMKANNLYFNHPTLNFHSSLGAVLDYDSNENELYVYDVDHKWIKKNEPLQSRRV